MNSIDLGRAFKAPFMDKEWPMKTLLGFVWTLLVVTIPAVYGAQLDYIRRVSGGNEELPDWSDFGNKWVQGFMVLLAGFVWFLPVMILFAVFMVPALIAGISSGGDSDMIGAAFGGGLCLFSLIAIVYSVVVSIFFYAAQVNYAMKGTFGAFFEFGTIMDKVRGGTGFFTAWLYALIISIALSTAMSVVSSITGGLGGILAPVVTYLTVVMTGHVLGQWAARAYGVTATYATPASGSYMPPAPPYEASVPPASVPPAPPAYTPPAPPAPPASEPVPPAPPAPPAPPEGEEAP